MEHYRDEDAIKKLGERIRSIRIERGLTMEELAADADMEYKQLSRIEKGEVNTSISRVFSLARALGVKVRDLF